MLANTDEHFTSIEAALQVVEKFDSRLTVGDAARHVRRSVDDLCAAATKKEAIEPAVHRLAACDLPRELAVRAERQAAEP